MGISFFGSGGKAGSALVGGLSGAAAGGPLGAAAGVISGLFGGGGNTQETTYEYSNLTGGQNRAVKGAEDALPALLAQLDPSVMNELISKLTGEMSGVAETGVRDTFRAERGLQKAASARSGGTLGTVQNVYDTQSSSEEGKALSSALLEARLGAEQIGQGRTQLAQSGAATATGVISGIEGTRRLLKTTGSQQTDQIDNFAGGLMGAFSDPMSYFNTNKDLSFMGGGKYSDFINGILGTGGTKNKPRPNGFVGPLEVA
jgi:hypothetical protein